MNRSDDDAGTPDQASVEAWLGELVALLPAGSAALDEIGPAERAVLLDLARVAAHRSHRIAAPMTTYLVGLVLGTTPRPERLAKMRELVDRLDRPTT
jgi:Domain of unknown function (DUF6457)